MRRVFGAQKQKEPPPSVQDTSDRITKRGENVDENIKKLDAELAKYKEQMKRVRPGPAQEAIKARSMRILKQKRMYEGQRDMLYNQTFNLDQVAFATEIQGTRPGVVFEYPWVEHQKWILMTPFEVASSILSETIACGERRQLA